MWSEKWSLAQLIRHYVCEALTEHQICREREKKIMSALSDLQDAVAKLSSDVDAFIAANSGGASDADLKAVTDAIKGIDLKVAPPAAPTA